MDFEVLLHELIYNQLTSIVLQTKTNLMLAKLAGLREKTFVLEYEKAASSAKAYRLKYEERLSKKRTQ